MDDEHGGRPTEPDVHDPGRPTLDAGEDLHAHGAGEDEALDDDDSTQEPQPEPPSPSKTRSLAWFVVGALLVASMVGPLVFYFLVWRYQSTALHHVPAGTTMAARFDGRELYLYEPFRKNVLSVFEDAEGTKSRAARLEKKTGINLLTDVRELVLATVDGKSWVALVGGRFHTPRLHRSDFVEGLASFLAEEGVDGFALEGSVLKGPGGVRIAQAEDSTLVVASDDAMLGATLEPSKHYLELGLASSGALSLVVDGPALAAVARTLPSLDGAEPIAKTARVTGFLDFRRKGPELVLDVVPKSGTTPEALAGELETALGAMRLVAFMLPDVGGSKEALGSAQVKPRTASVLVQAKWPEEKLAEATVALGGALRAVLGGG